MFKTLLFLTLLGLSVSQRFNSFRNRQQQQFRPRPNRFNIPQQTQQNTFRDRNNFQNNFRIPEVQPTAAPRVVHPSFVSAPRVNNRNFIRLLRSENDGPYPDGSYSFAFASEDGIQRSESGRSLGINPRTGYNIHSKQGSYSYVSPEGIQIDVNYEADDNGFRASSPVLPLGPPPPPHAVAQIRAAQEAFARRGLVFRSGFDNHPALRG